MHFNIKPIVAILVLSTYLSVNAFAAFKNSGTGEGTQVIADPLVPDHAYVSGDDAAQLFGYSTASDMVAAIAAGYTKTQADADQWAMANGQTGNTFPLASATGAFMVPGPNNTQVPLAPGQYDTDCQAIFSRFCTNITPQEFRQVRARTHAALIAGLASYAQQTLTAVTGWSPSDLSAAQLLGYNNTAEDYILYTGATQATYSECSAITGTTGYFVGICATIPKSSYLTILESIDAVSDVINAAPLTKALLLALNIPIPSNVNLDNSSVIAYLDDIIDSSSGLSPSDLAEEIASATPLNVAHWIVSQVSAGVLPPSDLTSMVLDTALDGQTSIAELIQFDPTNSLTTFQSAIRDSTGSFIYPTADSIRQVLINVAGFSSDASHATWQNNDDQVNFTSSTWEACYQSIATDANQCSTSAEAWTSLEEVLTTLESNTPSTVSISSLLAIAQDEGVETELSIAGTNPNAIHIDFVQTCLTNLPEQHRTSATIAQCAAGNSQEVATFGILGKLAGTYSGAITLAELQTANVSNAVVAALGRADGCGDNAVESCLTAFNNAHTSATGCVRPVVASANSARSITEFIQCVVSETFVLAGNNATYEGPSSVQTGCSATPELPLFALCAHAYWDCDVISLPDDWNLAAGNTSIAISQSTNVTSAAPITLQARLTLSSVNNPLRAQEYSRTTSITINVTSAIEDTVEGRKQFRDGSYYFKINNGGDYAFNAGRDDANGYSTQLTGIRLRAARAFCRSLGGDLGTDADHRSFNTNLLYYTYDNPYMDWDNLYESGCPRFSLPQCTNAHACVFNGNRGRVRNGSYCETTVITAWTLGAFTCSGLPQCPSQ